MTVPIAPNATSYFKRKFVALGNPERAAGERAYLKSSLRFHGVTVPQIRTTAGEFCRDFPALDRATLKRLVDQLFATDFHDLRSAAIAILERCEQQLARADLPWLIALVRQSGTWAHVDWLCTRVIGRVLDREPAAAQYVRRWARDPDLWVRRAALLVQLEPLRQTRGDFSLFTEVAAPMLEEREFFIRKAIGWVLRETSKKRPELCLQFLLEHGATASALTVREASKHLPPAMLDQLGRTTAKRRRVTAGSRGTK